MILRHQLLLFLELTAGAIAFLQKYCHLHRFFGMRNLATRHS